MFVNAGEDDLIHQFRIGPPGAPDWEKRVSVTVHFRAKELLIATLHVRKHGPSYLKYLSVPEISDRLTKFIQNNFWSMNDILFRNFDGSYASQVSLGSKERLTQALTTSNLFFPQNELALFPITPVRVSANFDSELFFLVQPNALTEARLPAGIDMQRIASDRCPPFIDWEGSKLLEGAWLGIRAPAQDLAKKRKAAVLGALALGPLPQYRYEFSLRSVLEGFCVFADTVTFCSGESHTPRLGSDIIIGASDHAWLQIVADKLSATDDESQRHVKALEYFYRAWSQEPSDRFAILCMTLGAIFPGRHGISDTETIVYGIRELIGHHVDKSRLQSLMRLRGDVIHGRAPDVLEAKKYASHYELYNEDPVRDLEIVAAACLRLKIFPGHFREQADPYADEIELAKIHGVLPKTFRQKSILDGNAFHSDK